jgi:hypothetical protein
MDGDDRGRLNTLKKDYESLRMHLDEGTDQEAAVKILKKWKKEEEEDGYDAWRMIKSQAMDSYWPWQSPMEEFKEHVEERAKQLNWKRVLQLIRSITT